MKKVFLFTKIKKYIDAAQMQLSFAVHNVSRGNNIKLNGALLRMVMWLPSKMTFLITIINLWNGGSISITGIPIKKYWISK